MDDFEYHEKWQPLINITDIIKIDFRRSTQEYCAQIVRQLKSPQLRFLAEKVETKEDVDRAQEMGYSLFQGYYYSKPKILQGGISPAIN